jgi:hypothetical protein
VAWAAAHAWRARQMPWLSRAHHVLFLLGCAGAAMIAWQGGLLIWDGKF